MEHTANNESKNDHMTLTAKDLEVIIAIIDGRIKRLETRAVMAMFIIFISILLIL